MTAPAALLARWQLTTPQLVAKTPRATVWKVTRSNGQTAAMKLLRPEETVEARGFRYLTALNGQGAVRVLAEAEGAILMDWCDGPSLGDLARSGQDDAATTALCTVIQTVHAAPCDRAGLWRLTDHFAPLTAPALDGDLGKAAHLARALLADPTPVQALHGDLHHDNVLHTPRGWLAIDPKGVWGDPAYEPANAFRNPDGLGESLFDPARVQQLVDRFSSSLGHSPRRLLGWAAAHCALSTRWALETGRDISDDLRLLPILLSALDGQPAG